MSIFTASVHAGRIAPQKPGTPSAPAIVTASSWTQAEAAALDAALGDENAGYVYARYGGPTQEALEAAVTALEQGAGAAVYGSGMAALHAALLGAGAGPGAVVVAASELYGATTSLLNFLAANSGVVVRRVDVRDLAATAAALPGAAVLLFEVISNPLCRVADAPALIQLARAAGARVVVDSTFTSPYLLQPLTLGADFVVHSLTKYLGGHGDVLGGVVAAAAAADAAALRAARKVLGANLSPFDAYLTLRGLRTLALRVREQNANAQTLAAWLAREPRVGRVFYSGLPADPDHALAGRILRAGCFGGVLAFELRGGRPAVFGFLERLRLILPATTLGDVTSLVLYPASASHRALTPEQRAALGISDGCLRVSAGIEAAADLIADLDQALG